MLYKTVKKRRGRVEDEADVRMEVSLGVNVLFGEGVMM